MNTNYQQLYENEQRAHAETSKRMASFQSSYALLVRAVAEVTGAKDGPAIEHLRAYKKSNDAAIESCRAMLKKEQGKHGRHDQRADQQQLRMRNEVEAIKGALAKSKEREKDVNHTVDVLTRAMLDISEAGHSLLHLWEEKCNGAIRQKSDEQRTRADCLSGFLMLILDHARVLSAIDKDEFLQRVLAETRAKIQAAHGMRESFDLSLYRGDTLVCSEHHPACE